MYQLLNSIFLQKCKESILCHDNRFFLSTCIFQSENIRLRSEKEFSKKNKAIFEQKKIQKKIDRYSDIARKFFAISISYVISETNSVWSEHI